MLIEDWPEKKTLFVRKMRKFEGISQKTIYRRVEAQNSFIC